MAAPVCLISLPCFAEEICADALSQLESDMQDGLHQRQVGDGLLQEAIQGVDAATSDDALTCEFLKNSVEHYVEAQQSFQKCLISLERALKVCPSEQETDWDGLSASPALCQEQVEALDEQIQSAQQDIDTLCVR